MFAAQKTEKTVLEVLIEFLARYSLVVYTVSGWLTTFCHKLLVHRMYFEYPLGLLISQQVLNILITIVVAFTGQLSYRGLTFNEVRSILVPSICLHTHLWFINTYTLPYNLPQFQLVRRLMPVGVYLATIWLRLGGHRRAARRQSNRQTKIALGLIIAGSVFASIFQHQLNVHFRSWYYGMIDICLHSYALVKFESLLLKGGLATPSSTTVVSLSSKTPKTSNCPLQLAYIHCVIGLPYYLLLDLFTSEGELMEMFDYWEHSLFVQLDFFKGLNLEHLLLGGLGLIFLMISLKVQGALATSVVGNLRAILAPLASDVFWYANVVTDPELSALNWYGIVVCMIGVAVYFNLQNVLKPKFEPAAVELFNVGGHNLQQEKKTQRKQNPIYDSNLIAWFVYWTLVSSLLLLIWLKGSNFV